MGSGMRTLLIATTVMMAWVARAADPLPRNHATSTASTVPTTIPAELASFDSKAFARLSNAERLARVVAAAQWRERELRNFACEVERELTSYRRNTGDVV